MEKIIVGISGCGHLGRIHCKQLWELSLENEFIEFAGVFDIISEKAEEVAQLYDIRSFQSEDEMFENINALIIATPTSTHFQIASKAAKRKINLFIEKPVTSTSEQAEKLTELRDKNDIKIQIGHIERFNPAIISLSGLKLNPMFIEAHRLAEFTVRGTDVSVVHDLMIHDLDMVFHLVKSDLKKIDASGVSVISDSVDIANARLEFLNGCVANLTASRISLKKMRKMRLFMKDTYVSVDFLEGRSKIFRLCETDEEITEPYIKLSDKKKIVITQPEYVNTNPIKSEIKEFFECIIENRPVRVTLDEAARTVKVAEEIIKIISEK
ncbi:MAG: Gfo/Idh/MocA family oxidoreductase [Ignavibacteria bacterium]|nr:Gfo/Idh/MocA family oxidoreductase [Ignavibacteria bacterium]